MIKNVLLYIKTFLKIQVFEVEEEEQEVLENMDIEDGFAFGRLVIVYEEDEDIDTRNRTEEDADREEKDTDQAYQAEDDNDDEDDVI